MHFASVILDVDSTLVGIEGIDVLAARAAPEVAVQIAALTERAMAGELPLERVYGDRLAAIRPSRRDVEALAEDYRAALAPGAARAVATLREAGVRLALISGGIREAILPVARDLGFADADVHAVSVSHDASGAYAGYDERSPLATQRGKGTVAAGLALPRRSLAVGDGSTDLAMRPAVDAFAAFTGFARREAVIARADFVLSTFDALLMIVLS